MKFLYVQAMTVNREGADIVEALRNAGHDAEEYTELLRKPDYLDDSVIAALETYIHNHHVDILVSIHFVLNLAFTAYKNSIRYIALLWDAPFIEARNPLGKIDNVYISTFDKLDRRRFLDFGAKHVIYQPLCVNARLFEEWTREIQETLQGSYIHDISFIGQLYDNNAYDWNVNKFPRNLQHYFNSIFEEAAFKWDGVNRIYGKTGKEMIAYIKLVNPNFKVPNRWEIKDEEYFEQTCLVKKVAHIERTAILNLLAENYDVALYTGSREAAKKTLQNVNIGPPVENGKATSVVYTGSKINLNIALKGIEQGTPQRIMDIMGAGGFVLSAYCPETAELFEEDREIVFFKTPEELLEKTDYYLTHDAERRQIAKAGHAKVINRYTYDKKISKLLAWMDLER